MTKDETFHFFNDLFRFRFGIHSLYPIKWKQNNDGLCVIIFDNSLVHCNQILFEKEWNILFDCMNHCKIGLAATKCEVRFENNPYFCVFNERSTFYD